MQEAKIAMTQMVENLGDAQVSLHHERLGRTIYFLELVVTQGQDVAKHLKRLYKKHYDKAYRKGGY